MQPYMPEETLKRIMLLENRIAELEEQLMIEKEFGMHYHAEFMKLFEKGVEQDERIAEQDLLLAQWESIDELNRERSQQRLQRIAQLEAESNRRLELLIEIYETDGVGLTSYILVKIEEELGDDYFNRHTT